MLVFLRLLIKTLALVIVSIIGINIFVRFLQRFPGVIVALSIICIGILAFALYRGSFSAVGLHTKKSVRIALIVSLFIFVLSTCIVIFVH